MVTTIEGIYENGQITLLENPKFEDKMKVFVLFTEEKTKNEVLLKRPFGIMKGEIELPEDFNEPLEDLKKYM